MRRQWKFVMKLLWSAFIALNVWLYRVSGGRMMGKMGAAPILLVTTTGRKSGRARTTPVLYLADGGRFVIVPALRGIQPGFSISRRIQRWSCRCEADGFQPPLGAQAPMRKRNSGRASPVCTRHMRTIRSALRVTFQS